MLSQFEIIFHFLVKFHSIKQICITSTAMMSLLWVIAAFAQTPGHPPLKIGGPCDYVSYKGSAKIVSIIPRKEPTYPGKEEYEIRFLFLPEGEVNERRLHLEREMLLLICGSYYPTNEFIIKYDVKVGKIFPCVARVEVRGDCDPLTFDFPFIEETQKLCPPGIPWPRPEYFDPQQPRPGSSKE